MIAVGKSNLPTLSSRKVGAPEVSSNYNSGMVSASQLTLGERIKVARLAVGLTQMHIANHFKIARVSVTQWENNTTKPDTGRIVELAALLNVTMDWLLDGTGQGPAITKEAPSQRSHQNAPIIIPGAELVGVKDMPVYAAAMGGDGHLLISFEPIDYVKRPSVLQNVTGGYGILIKGQSMIPAYWEGDTALVNPHLPPARDSDAVFYHTPPKGQGEEQAIIKRLVGISDRHWKLQQYNPAKEFSEERVDWPICHRVVGKYNAR